MWPKPQTNMVFHSQILTLGSKLWSSSNLSTFRSFCLRWYKLLSPFQSVTSLLSILNNSEIVQVCINAGTGTVPRTQHPGSVNVDGQVCPLCWVGFAWRQVLAWWAVKVLRIKPVAWSSLLAHSGCSQKEDQCQAHYWTAPTRFCHISRPSGCRASHQVLLIFLFSVTVVVRINDNDFDADFVTLRESCAAVHHIGRMCCKPPWNILHACTIKGTIWYGEA